MRRNLRTSLGLAGLGAAVCLGPLVARLLVAKPPESTPIVVQFRETPLFSAPHEHSVAAIAFSPDGRTLATGAHDGGLRQWDVATGRLRSLHTSDATRGIHGLAFSPDGRRIATVGAFLGGEAVVWDAATGQIAHQIALPAGAPQAGAAVPGAVPMTYRGKTIVFHPLNAVAYSPDGRTLATVGDTVVLRDADTGAALATLEHPVAGVAAAAFSADGKTLATAAADRKVRLWSMPGGALRTTLDGPRQPLSAVAISADGQHVVAASSSRRLGRGQPPPGNLWYWERDSGPPRRIELAATEIRQVAFLAHAKVLVAAGRELLSIDLSGNEVPQPRKISTHSEDLHALAVSPDGRLAAAGGADRTVDIIELATGKLLHRLPGLNDIVSAVAADDDGAWYATATIDRRFANRMPDSDPSFAARYEKYFAGAANAGRMQPGEVRVWSTADGQPKHLLPLATCQVTALRSVPRGEQLAVAGWIPGQGGMLSLWDAGGGRHVRDYAVGRAEVLSIAVSPDGRTLASGDAEGNLDLWDVVSGAKTRSHKHEHAIEAVAISADGKHLATGDARRTVRVFDAGSLAIERTLNSRSHVESLDFSPDATLLAAGTRDPGLELWDLRGDAPSRTLVVPGDHFAVMPGFVAFSPDGRFVVCGGHGKDIAVFDVASGRPHCELRGHEHAATAAAFLPDGRLVSGGEERTVRLWDAEGNKLLATWLAVPADANQQWGDEWVGWRPTGEFVGSVPLDRLVGWQTGGDAVSGPEDGERRKRVESLFPARRD